MPIVLPYKIESNTEGRSGDPFPVIDTVS